LEDAFDKNDDEFFIHYGFCKPKKGDENVVVACHSGGRAISSVDKLRRLGYGSIK
jgi:rhodanese-related sulfurtransferase